MTDEKRGGPPSRGPGGDRNGRPGGGRDGRPGGGGRDGKRGGFGKGGFGKPAPRAETYESLRELTRGEGFRIDKFMLAEKGTHKLVKTEYRLTREGLKEVQNFQRLVDAQAAAIAPLPEPEPEPVEEIAVEEAVGVETAEEGAVAESEHIESAPEDTGGDSVEHVAEPEAGEAVEPVADEHSAA